MDAEIQSLLQKVKEANRTPFWQSTPEAARNGPMLMQILFGEPPQVERVEDFTIASSNGFQLPVRLYVPGQQPKGLIVYFHGGGWVIGTVAAYHPFTATLAQRTGCVDGVDRVDEGTAAELGAGHVPVDAGRSAERHDLDVDVGERPVASVGGSLVEPEQVGRRLVEAPVEARQRVAEHHRQVVAARVVEVDERSQVRAA